MIESNEISLTYIDDLFPILLKMIENNEVGICNFTNPGTINLIDIINIYKQYYIEHNYVLNSDCQKTEQTDKKRSHAKLLPNKILKYNPLNIKEAIEQCVKKYVLNTMC